MRKDVWVFIFSLGLLLFGWPLLSIFRRNPALYLFAAWAAFVGIIYVVSSFTGREDRG